jgi:glycosyltransferase involved in cell wall biosynthesis
MNTVQVSFIIPVYNAERYLACCLDSVLNQTVSDIEVICVNDCSTDDSIKILDDYSARDTRIKLIDFKKNKGPGAARNAGLAKVSGEFVRMVDADDYIPVDSTEKLLGAAKKYESNYVRGGFQKCTLAGTIQGKGWNFPPDLIVNISSKKDLRLWRFDQHWSYLYRSKSLLAAGVRYDESMRNGQDAAFIIDLMPHMDKVTLIPETVYYYRENPASIMRRRRDKLFYLNVLGLYEKVYGKMEEIGTQEAADYIFFLALCNYLPQNILASIPENLDYDDAIEVLQYLKKIFIQYDGKNLCFDQKYIWQNSHQIPWISKYFVLLLNEGFLSDLYYDLKQIGEQNSRDRLLSEKINTYEYTLENIYNSTSWKITSPVRYFGRLFRRINEKSDSVG